MLYSLDKCLFIYTDVNRQMDMKIQKYIIETYINTKKSEGIYIYENNKK